MQTFKNFTHQAIPFIVLKEEETHILYRPILGKPHPQEAWQRGSDLRSRISQKGVPRETSFDRACSFLRNHIGDKSPDEFKKAREFEKICSKRKEDILKASSLEEKIFINEKFVFDIAPHLYQALPLMKNTVHKDVEREDFSTLENYLQRLESIIDMLKIENFGLKISGWTPENGIDGLIVSLKAHGPLAIKGLFGKHIYKEAPFAMKDLIASKEIYAWPKGAPLSEQSNSCNSVVIIGAKKVTEKGYVYFVDPQDANDPNDLSIQKIYLISFERFCNNLYDLHMEKYDPNQKSDYACQAHKIQKIYF